MAAIVEEMFYSREADVGESASADLGYIVLNESDEVLAQAAALRASPSAYRSMPRRSSSVKRLATDIYEVHVKYSLELNQTQPEQTDGGGNVTTFDVGISFNMVGGTVHITNALETRFWTGHDSRPVDVKKTIGLDVKSGSVRGLDIFAPVFDFSLTAQLPDDVMTEQYREDVMRLTGCVNDDAFFNGDPGEILFKGARGARHGKDPASGKYIWEIGYEFAFSENATELRVGDIGHIDKGGWEYLEVIYRDSTDSGGFIGGKPIQVPAQVNVHTVYKSGDFSKLKIGTQQS